MTEQIVLYTCEACKAKFEVEQGSRQRFCPTCLIKRIKRQGRKEK